MSLETLKDSHKQVLDCEVKDDTGLNDFQKLPNTVEIAIPRVGIERFRLPLTFKHQDGMEMTHDAQASMFIYLCSGKTGANMSRFVSILQEEASKHSIGNGLFKSVLKRFRADLRDYETEDLIQEAEFGLKFSYPVKQPSLKSGNWGWQYYDCQLKGIENKAGKILMELTLNYEYSSTCPCSLSMSKQYEEDFRQGKTTEGNGIATAHGQRSLATVTVKYDVDTCFCIEDLITLLRVALPTETQSLVKRVDEQAFAILNGENPMFVEHVSRRLALVLNEEAKILDWNVKIEHFESLHSHNAVAYIHKESPKLH